MVTPQFEDFYNKWYEKAHSYTDNSLSDVFDKFITLFIIYNSLYKEVWNRLLYSNPVTAGKKFIDNKAATDGIIQYLTSTWFLEQLLNDRQNQEYLSAICTLINEKKIAIIVPQFFSNRKLTDTDLLKKLQSSDDDKKTKAILELIYNIRCNLLHGSKEFAIEQKELLIPVTHLLEKTVEIVYGKLNE